MSSTVTADDRSNVNDLLETIEAEGWSVADYDVSRDRTTLQVRLSVTKQ